MEVSFCIFNYSIRKKDFFFFFFFFFVLLVSVFSTPEVKISALTGMKEKGE